MRILSVPVLSCVITLFAGLSLAQGAESSIQVQDAWARQAPMMPSMGHMHAASGNGAVYVTLRNAGHEPDALVGASSDAAESVELHETIREGDVMRMRPVTKLQVPAGGVLEMKPGGLHIMLINLKRGLRPGDRIHVTLNFEHAAPVSLEVPVR
jgi:copper(I)-binding protein